MPVTVHESLSREFLFYALAFLILLFGLFKVFYTRYFNTIFRVFFNTSLRQTQLTDILLQARLPSLIFNIFFILSTGIYVWFVQQFYRNTETGNTLSMISICIASVGLIYVCKYFGLKLIGWLSGMQEAADSYIFIIFLINKIAGIVLIPFIILMAFAKRNWMDPLVVSSFFVIGLLFLLRYLRSYSLLRHKITITRFHFLLYVAALEILPLVIIFRIARESL